MSRALLPYQLVVAAFVLLRLLMHIAGAPLGDETYYWYWGQQPDLSYYDHPPLHAWLLGIVSLLGWWPVSPRILTWATLGGTLWLFWLYARRYAPSEAPLRFWQTSALYLGSPLFFAMTLVSYHDHLLILLCLASAWFFITFAEDHEAGRTRWSRLYIAAALLGLAVLTKYNGVLFGLGAGLFFLVRPRLRALMLAPHLWLAAALAVAMQLPVFSWNLANGLSSYQFHLSTRWGGAHAVNWTAPLTFLAASALSLGPFLVWPLVRLLFGRGDAVPDVPRTLACTTVVVSTLVLAAISTVLGAYFYWNIVAFIAAMPLLAPLLGRRLQFWLHTAFGLLAAGLIVFNFSIAPIAPLTGGRDGGSAVNFGWETVAERVAAQLALHPDAELAGTRYSIASQIGFALRLGSITALSREQDQFDYWFDADARRGTDYLILADDNDDAAQRAYLEQHFDVLTTLETIPVRRFGVEIFSFHLLLGKGYRP